MAGDLSLTVRVSRGFDGFALDIDQVFPLQGISALFGPSGSGKTTILRIIAGLETATGVVALGERAWLDSDAGVFVRPHLRGAGLVFQDARLFGHLDVAGNLAFGMKAAGASAADWDMVVGALDLDGLLDRAAGALSGGEKQRVALGRALLAKPALLLLDEPLGALDGRRKMEILPYLQRLATEFKVPTLFVSHSVEEVSQLAAHVTLIEAGRVVASGPTDEMLERPDLQSLTGRFEAGSTLQAVVIGHDQAFRLTRLEVAGQQIIMPMLKSLEVGQRVPLRLRARDVALANGPLAGISIRNQLHGVVADIHPEPDTAFAEVVVDLNGARIQSRVTRFALAELGLVEGAPVVVLVKSVAFDRRGLVNR